MVSADDITCIPLSDDEIKSMISKALEYFSIAKRDNLRSRHINIQFDCLLRGYIGEYAMVKWLKQNGVILEVTNYISQDENIDIDFLYKEKNIELKTSLVPDADCTIQQSVSVRDIKLIKREDDISDLRGDIHLQIFFNQRRKAKDDWLKKRTIDLTAKNIEEIFETLLARAYRNTVYFIGWIDKPALIEHINNLPEEQRTWTFPGSKRKFWNYKIADCNKPAELPAYLKRL